MTSISPKLRNTVAIFHRGDKLLLLEPEIPDWLVVDKRYYEILKRMNGENLLEDIMAYIRDAFGEEAALLQKQVDHLSANSLLFEHNPFQPPMRAATTPKFLYLTITDRCNLKCSYCYAKARKPSPELQLADWLAIVDKFIDTFGALTFTFTGGEPLLVDYVFELAAHLRGRQCTTILLTNGILLERREIAKRAAATFSEIRISLDSLDDSVNCKLRGEGSSRVMAGYRNSAEQGRIPVVQCTVCSENKDTLSEFARTFNKGCNFQPLFQAERQTESQTGSGELQPGLSGDAYFQALKQAGVQIPTPGHRHIHDYRHNPYKRCALAAEELSIGPNGDIFPCHLMHYDSTRVGNALCEHISTLYEDSPVLKSLRTLNVDTIAPCRECVVRNFCGAACRARIGAEGVDPSRHDDFCSFEKASILEALFKSFDQSRL